MKRHEVKIGKMRDGGILVTAPFDPAALDELIGAKRIYLPYHEYNHYSVASVTHQDWRTVYYALCADLRPLGIGSKPRFWILICGLDHKPLFYGRLGLVDRIHNVLEAVC